MILDHNQFKTKEDFLWHIYNDLGCKDLTLCYNYIGKDGVMYFSKWKKYEELLSYEPDEHVPGTIDTKKQFLDKVSHRTVLDIEVMLDVDEPGGFYTIKEKAIWICKELVKHKLEYSCYFTGSKSYHISILFPELRDNHHLRNEIVNILNNIGADILKASKRTPIALENAIHYKSGKKKQMVNLIC